MESGDSREEYLREAKGQNDPIATYLAIKKVVDSEGEPNYLRKIGNCLLEENDKDVCYAEINDNFKSVLLFDQLCHFSCGGSLSLENNLRNIRLQVRDEEYLGGLPFHEVLFARRTASQLPWHDAGGISNLDIQVLKDHCKPAGSNPLTLPTGAEDKPERESIRFQFKNEGANPRKSPFLNPHCSTCSSKMVLQHDGDQPHFLDYIKPHLAKTVAKGEDIILVPLILKTFSKGGGLAKGNHQENYRFDKNEENMLGILLVTFPTYYRGGQINIYNMHKKKEFDLAGNFPKEKRLQWVAFSWKCQYEILPVTKGMSTILVYGIRRCSPARNFNESDICPTCKPLPVEQTENNGTREEQENITETVNRAMKNLKRNLKKCTEQKIGLFLSNVYPMNKLKPEALKGGDHLLFEAFKNSGFQVNLKPVICHLSIRNGGMVVGRSYSVYSFDFNDLERIRNAQRPSERTEDVQFLTVNPKNVALDQTVKRERFFMFVMEEFSHWEFDTAMIISLRSPSKIRQELMYKTEEVEEDSAGSAEVCEGCLKYSYELTEPLMKCSRCKKAKYCSRECQREHWKTSHKYTCGK